MHALCEILSFTEILTVFNSDLVPELFRKSCWYSPCDHQEPLSPKLSPIMYVDYRVTQILL